MDHVELRKLVSDENIENLSLGDLVSFLVSAEITANNLGLMKDGALGFRKLTPEDEANLAALPVIIEKIYYELNRREEKYRGGNGNGEE
ncbi:hypothetical protein HZA97_05930 [Candidatus Woesearchaeota archaeon]|nr:hypothetical protein [Candidatus Woesearchaeota archaeon]